MDKFARWTSLTECGTSLEIQRGASAGTCRRMRKTRGNHEALGVRRQTLKIGTLTIYFLSLPGRLVLFQKNRDANHLFLWEIDVRFASTAAGGKQIQDRRERLTGLLCRRAQQQRPIKVSGGSG